ARDGVRQRCRSEELGNGDNRRFIVRTDGTSGEANECAGDQERPAWGPHSSCSLCPSFGPPEPKSPHLRSGKCLFPARIRADVKARFVDFKPATHLSGTFPTGTMRACAKPRAASRNACTALCTDQSHHHYVGARVGSQAPYM